MEGRGKIMSIEDYHNLAYWADDEDYDGPPEKAKPIWINVMNDDELRDLLNHMFEALEKPSEELTEWEEGFVESLKEQFKRNGVLSVRQREILERIYAEKTP